MNPIDISALRKALGLSQVEFARLFDVHFMTVSKWERGVIAPTPYQVGLMNQFRLSANAKQEKMKEELQGILIGAGVIAALVFLLGAAK